MIRNIIKRMSGRSPPPPDGFSRSYEEAAVSALPPLSPPPVLPPVSRLPHPIVHEGTHLSAADLKDSLTRKPTWCPGCGDYGVWFALKNALQRIGVPHERIVVVYGIGCHGHLCGFLHTYAFEGLHGRPIPVAEGIKIANDRLKVIVVAGDGDTYGEGMNHFLSAIRANHDITLIVHNNMVYGLTTGQSSPTSEKGYKSRSTPDGAIEVPVNPVAIALAAGGGFVARGFAGNVAHLTEVLVEAMKHDGFSVVDVFQNCVAFNSVNTIRWFNDRVYDLKEEGHDPADRMKALQKAFEWGERLPVGVFYRDGRESYQNDLAQLKQGPLVERPTERIDLSKLFERYA